MKRFCILINNLPPVYTGGGRQALSLASEFRRLGREVFFITRKYDGLREFEQVNGLDIHRLRYTNVGFRNGPQLVVQLYRLCSTLIYLRDRYDVVLYFNPDGGFHCPWFTIVLLHLFRKKSACRMGLLYSSDPLGLSRRRFAQWRLLPYRLHDRVISISRALTMSYLTVFSNDRKLNYVPNGVDTNLFRPLSDSARRRQCEELGLDGSFVYCSFVGRLCYRKGVDILIKAWKRIVAQVPNARLLLIGPEGDKYRNVAEKKFINSIECKIEEHELSRTIFRIGFTGSVEKYLQVSDLLLFPSRREGCPNALLEAMSCGLPVVAARIRNITDDLVRHGREGYIVEPEAPHQLAQKAVEVLSSQNLRSWMGQQARERILRDHDIRSVAKKYLQILEDL